MAAIMTATEEKEGMACCILDVFLLIDILLEDVKTTAAVYCDGCYCRCRKKSCERWIMLCGCVMFHGDWTIRYLGT
jgi:hypothetical protein